MQGKRELAEVCARSQGGELMKAGSKFANCKGQVAIDE